MWGKKSTKCFVKIQDRNLGEKDVSSKRNYFRKICQLKQGEKIQTPKMRFFFRLKKKTLSQQAIIFYAKFFFLHINV